MTDNNGAPSELVIGNSSGQAEEYNRFSVQSYAAGNRPMTAAVAAAKEKKEEHLILFKCPAPQELDKNTAQATAAMKEALGADKYIDRAMEFVRSSVRVSERFNELPAGTIAVHVPTGEEVVNQCISNYKASSNGQTR